MLSLLLPASSTGRSHHARRPHTVDRAARPSLSEAPLDTTDRFSEGQHVFHPQEIKDDKFEEEGDGGQEEQQQQQQQQLVDMLLKERQLLLQLLETEAGLVEYTGDKLPSRYLYDTTTVKLSHHIHNIPKEAMMSPKKALYPQKAIISPKKRVKSTP
jgi:hypothetical protein